LGIQIWQDIPFFVSKSSVLKNFDIDVRKEEPMKAPTNDDDPLPIQLTVARFFVVNGRFATLLACPLFCVLNLLSIPGFGFQ
jgi:hypothetical protein